MGKHEPMTAKAIGKRIKAKGLQKLKFYCQMCQKQCRDANGFKCHLTSEAHQRQLLLFAENPHRYMDGFSSEFLKDFLHLLKRRYSTKRVLANQVYQEYIKDRHHLHMNSTRWCTLTGFVKWMGRKGICHVEDNEKGWYITYIDRDPETLKREEQKAKKEKLFLDDDERQAKLVNEQIERGKRSEIEFKVKNGIAVDGEESNENLNRKPFKKENEDQKITFSFKPSTTTTMRNKAEDISNQSIFDSESNNDKSRVQSKTIIMKEGKRKKSALDEIIEEQERWKMKQAEKANTVDRRIKSETPVTWLIPRIIVRVVCPDLGSEYHEKKARIESVESFTAKIKMLNNGHLLKVDEKNLETVIPSKSGSKVMILRGLYREHHGRIHRIDDKNEEAFVLVQGATDTEPKKFSFDDISKLDD